MIGLIIQFFFSGFTGVGKGQWPGELGGPVTSEVLWVIGSSVWLKLLLQSDRHAVFMVPCPVL